jgi:hypothetical protein
MDQTLLFNQTPVKVVGEIRGKRSIGQSFVARRDQLCRIDVLASTCERRNTRDLIFRLKTSPDAQAALATVRINASQVVEGGYVSFVFPPQANSCGQAYYFCIESPESIAGDAISLWAFRHANLAEAALYQNGVARQGMLIFGAFYWSDPWGEVGERPIPVDLQRATTQRERWLKAYRLLTTQGLVGLIREIKNYRRWQAAQRRNAT